MRRLGHVHLGCIWCVVLRLPLCLHLVLRVGRLAWHQHDVAAAVNEDRGGAECAKADVEEEGWWRMERMMMTTATIESEDDETNTRPALCMPKLLALCCSVRKNSSGFGGTRQTCYACSKLRILLDHISPTNSIRRMSFRQQRSINIPQTQMREMVRREVLQVPNGIHET